MKREVVILKVKYEKCLISDRRNSLFPAKNDEGASDGTRVETLHVLYEDGVRKLSCEHTTPSCNLQVSSLTNPRFLERRQEEELKNK